ncbi:MAG TPA: acetyl-CoA carboxylase biotin carboxyl carrier protein [Terriglobia bacterium]|nr:acetyl-CoA carboxylase biotin carboxyl carrier protein [Terriglobia bacterium]
MPGRKGKQGKKAPSPAWDLHEIRDLLDLLIKREITEFELEKGGAKIRVKRGDSRSEPQVVAPYKENSFLPPPPPPPRQHVDTHAAVAVTGEPSGQESTEGLFVIKSPIVGTFFAAPAPNAPPFVQVGDNVSVGQVLCIIEAMKLMNEIESEAAGEIVRVYVENGQPVEYSQSLFAIRPSHKK